MRKIKGAVLEIKRQQGAFNPLPSVFHRKTPTGSVKSPPLIVPVWNQTIKEVRKLVKRLFAFTAPYSDDDDGYKRRDLVQHRQSTRKNPREKSTEDRKKNCLPYRD